MKNFKKRSGICRLSSGKAYRSFPGAGKNCEGMADINFGKSNYP